MDVQQRVAGDRIERLDPAIQQHWQFPELSQSKTFFPNGHEGAYYPRGKNRAHDPWQPFFHEILLVPGSPAPARAGSAPFSPGLDFFGRTSGDFGWMRRRLKKLKRLMQKWVRRPPPIKVQATYGVAAAGFWTTCKIVTPGFFSSNPAWK